MESGAEEAAEWSVLARSDCRGARFIRCALQVNPFAYLQRHSKQTAFSDEASYNKALIAACKENGIEAIGVTDHFRIRSGEGLLNAAADAGIAGTVERARGRLGWTAAAAASRVPLSRAGAACR